MAVRIGDGEWVADHAATPGESGPSEGVGYNDLEHYIIRLVGRDISGLGYAVDDVAGECSCCFRL